MIDDMDGLFTHASEAYRAGKREGRERFFNRVISALGFIGVKHEKANEKAAFHAVEACTKAVVAAKADADAPQHDGVS